MFTHANSLLTFVTPKVTGVTCYAIARVTSGVTNVNRLFAWVNNNWKIKKFDYNLITDIFN